MISIKKLSKILPIKYNGLTLDLLTLEDLDWYLKNLRSPYYEKYLDFKFSKDISSKELREAISNMIVSYQLKIESPCEARFLLKEDDTNTIIGGCTVFERNTHPDSVEIAYFIIPEYQNRNMGYHMVKNLCQAMNQTDMQFKKIEAVVRSDNAASINMLSNLGFREKCREHGKYRENIIMWLNREYINDIK
jgi:RimJ/RimL family protein N-acetyltransferase